LTALLTAASIVAAGAAAEILLPGRPVYHAGWWNVAIAALVVLVVAAGRRRLRSRKSARDRWIVVAAIAGSAMAGFASVASGLLAPDDRTFIGAPGQRVEAESLGVLSFPLTLPATPSQGSVVLMRRLHAPVTLGDGRRDVGDFVVRTVARDVVYVEARDLRGNRLTITQPSGAAFLSPVLLLEHRQTIAGLDLPYDSFTVPAARRVVKAVAFTAAQAAMLLRGGAQAGAPAVLFAVDDESERPLPHAIGLSAAGRTVHAGGLELRGILASYPAVEVVAAPNLAATIAGALLVLAAFLGLLSGNHGTHVAKDDAALGKVDALGR
jgi:hypothetical protein